MRLDTYPLCTSVSHVHNTEPVWCDGLSQKERVNSSWEQQCLPGSENSTPITGTAAASWGLPGSVSESRLAYLERLPMYLLRISPVHHRSVLSLTHPSLTQLLPHPNFADYSLCSLPPTHNFEFSFLSVRWETTLQSRHPLPAPADSYSILFVVTKSF